MVFKIKFRNQYGWGAITHRKVLIDKKPPWPFEIKVQKEDLTDPRPILLFETTDETSEIEYYEIILNKESYDKTTSAGTKNNPYQPQPLPPGKYALEIKAFDKAGNNVSAFANFEILAIEMPIITKYPKRLNVGEKAILEGKSLPEITILVFIQETGKEPEKQETKADAEGNWVFASAPLEKGSYEAWVQAIDKRGALSLPSQRASFEVGLSPLLKIGTIAISYLTIMSTLIVLIVAAAAVIFYGWYKINIWRKRMRTETKEALNVSEEFISKEVKDIEKELE